MNITSEWATYPPNYYGSVKIGDKLIMLEGFHEMDAVMRRMNKMDDEEFVARCLWIGQLPETGKVEIDQ